MGFVAASLFLAAAVAGWSEPSERIEVVTTEIIPFVQNGHIELRDSFGEVRVEGWNRPQVEIVVRRATLKTYPASLHAELRNQLDRILIHGQRSQGDHLLISTEIPAGTAFTRPGRANPNLDLVYAIKAPLHTDLVIRHGYGGVEVVNMAGSADISDSAGGITLELPSSERYLVDARSQRGAVTSEFSEPDDRPLLAEAHRLYLRLGVGDINIRKLPD